LEEFYFTDIVAGIGLFYSPKCASTNTLLKSCLEAYEKGKNLGLYTFHQTAGRGQGAATWESEAGKNLALSLAYPIKPNLDSVAWNKAVTLGVKNGLQFLLDFPVKIKWPNDLYVEDDKICGLLLESITDIGNRKINVAGIGINVNQTSWIGDFNACSLKSSSGKNYDLMLVLRTIIDSIQENVKKINTENLAGIHTAFNAELYKRNQPVTLIKQGADEISGLLLNIDEQGRICIDTNGITRCFHHGEARLKKQL
jgi:BirA family biotin operon repressor/biotin-[acetyl-CoA-carboxylase] ligase